MEAYKVNLIYKGNVDDIRNSLKHCEATITVDELKAEVAAELADKNRTSVINLLNAAIKRKLKK